MLENKRILITGGTGSLGKRMLFRLVKDAPNYKSITIFSRDEDKQHSLSLDIKQIRTGSNINFIIGDIRDPDSVAKALQDIDVVINAAALKHVPGCEQYPEEAIKTNTHGAINIVKAIKLFNLPIETVVGISTDKACKPVNTMGMTKALQEKIFIQANLQCPQTRFIVTRYGNVMNSRGSIIPVFLKLINEGRPLTITHKDMTRFLMSLDQSVDIVMRAINEGNRGDTFIPIVPSARIEDLVSVLVGDKGVEIITTGIRPGEKLHEILVSEEESIRTTKHDGYYIIHPYFDMPGPSDGIFEYSSKDNLIGVESIKELVEKNSILI